MAPLSNPSAAKSPGQRVFAVLLTVLLCSVGAAAQSPGKLTVHFFDVGQGDSALIITPGGQTLLIDGGPPEAGPHLASRLKTLAHGPLNRVLLTHPHLDHLGGLPWALRAVGAERFIDPGFNHPSHAYAQLLQLLIDQRIPLRHPEVRAGAGPGPVSVELGDGVTLTVFWPRLPAEPFLGNTRSDVNANSIVARLTYGKTAFLFAGDAEPETESHLLAEHAELRATVLKVGHHGGHHSSTDAWLAAIRPRFAVISCGAHNPFGHPGAETLERLARVHAQVFRTDEEGEVTAVSDGTDVRLSSERSGDAAAPMPTDLALGPYVASRRSAVFHRSSCPVARKMKPQNRRVFHTRGEALRSLRPAKDCQP